MQRIPSHYPGVFLHTGECYVGRTPTMVSTVLGSCVAVTLFSRQRSVGCICHAFLPDSREALAGREFQACRFVDTAIESMLASMAELGIKAKSLEVKVFGGASGCATGLGEKPGVLMGPRNVAAVQTQLDRLGLTSAASDVGGSLGRKLRFLTSTGEVWVKRIASSCQPPAGGAPGKSGRPS